MYMDFKFIFLNQNSRVIFLCMPVELLLFITFVKCLRKYVRFHWSVRVYYISMRFTSATRVRYRIIMHEWTLSSSNARTKY